MPRKQHSYHYLYKTTNLINNKYYYGMHSTSNLDDEYLGSGKRLRYSIRKYGKENFKREILEMFDSREELIQGEIALITEDLLNDSMCMNLMNGGSGGCQSPDKQRNWIIAGSQAFSTKIKNDLSFAENFSTMRRDLVLDEFAIGKRERIHFHDWTGKQHKEETKQKIGQANSIKQKGENNSQFGTCWITKDSENKKIKREELESFILQGWSKGRRIKD